MRKTGLTVHPAARAGATLRVIMLMGKFQGVMAATTPTGCLMASMRRSFCTVAKMSPVTLRPSSANHSMEDTLLAEGKLLTLRCPQGLRAAQIIYRVSSCNARDTRQLTHHVGSHT